MDFTAFTRQCEHLSVFRFFPIHMEIKHSTTQKYLYHSSNTNWGGYTYEEFEMVDLSVIKDFYVEPDRSIQLERYKRWIVSGSRLPLRLTFRINAKNGEVKRIQTHFEHIPDDLEPNRYLLEFSWDITEVVDNCLKDKTLIEDVNRKVFKERNQLRAENGLLRIAIDKIRDAERLAEFVKDATNLKSDELPTCLSAHFPDLFQIDNRATGLSAAREIEEVQRLEGSLLDLQENALPALSTDIDRIIDTLRSQLLMLRIQRNDGIELDSYLDPASR